MASARHFAAFRIASWSFTTPEESCIYSSPPMALLRVDNRNVAIDAEGYPRVLDDWSEDFPQAQVHTTGEHLSARNHALS